MLFRRAYTLQFDLLKSLGNTETLDFSRVSDKCGGEGEIQAENPCVSATLSPSGLNFDVCLMLKYIKRYTTESHGKSLTTSEEI